MDNTPNMERVREILADIRDKIPASLKGFNFNKSDRSDVAGERPADRTTNPLFQPVENGPGFEPMERMESLVSSIKNKLYNPTPDKTAERRDKIAGTQPGSLGGFFTRLIELVSSVKNKLYSPATKTTTQTTSTPQTTTPSSAPVLPPNTPARTWDAMGQIPPSPNKIPRQFGPGWTNMPLPAGGGIPPTGPTAIGVGAFPFPQRPNIPYSPPSVDVNQTSTRKNFLGDVIGSALAKLKSLPGISEGMRDVRHGMTGGDSPGSSMKGIGDVFGGIGKLASGIPVIGKWIEGFGKLAGGAFKAVGALQEWSEQLHQSNMQFADFSGAMAAVQGQQIARDIQLNREKGDSRADSARELAEAKSRLNNAVAPFENAFAKIKNKIAAGFDNGVSYIVEGANKWFEKLVEIMGNKKNNEGPGNGIATEEEWLFKMGKDWASQWGKRPKQ